MGSGPRGLTGAARTACVALVATACAAVAMVPAASAQDGGDPAEPQPTVAPGVTPEGPTTTVELVVPGQSEARPEQMTESEKANRQLDIVIAALLGLAAVIVIASIVLWSRTRPSRLAAAAMPSHTPGTPRLPPPAPGVAAVPEGARMSFTPAPVVRSTTGTPPAAAPTSPSAAPAPPATPTPASSTAGAPPAPSAPTPSAASAPSVAPTPAPSAAGAPSTPPTPAPSAAPSPPPTLVPSAPSAAEGAGGEGGPVPRPVERSGGLWASQGWTGPDRVDVVATEPTGGGHDNGSDPRELEQAPARKPVLPPGFLGVDTPEEPA